MTKGSIWTCALSRGGQYYVYVWNITKGTIWVMGQQDTLAGHDMNLGPTFAAKVRSPLRP